MAVPYYSEYIELPDYQVPVWDDKHEIIDDGTERPKWSGKAPPPAPGMRVRVKMNNLGAGEVIGYFVEHGWLGLIVILDDKTRPEWHVRQCGTGSNRCLIFGAECEPEMQTLRPEWTNMIEGWVA